MIDQPSKDFLRCFMVVAQLGTARRVRESKHAVAQPAEKLLPACLQDARRLVDTANRRNNPKFVANSHSSVFA